MMAIKAADARSAISSRRRSCRRRWILISFFFFSLVFLSKLFLFSSSSSSFFFWESLKLCNAEMPNFSSSTSRTWPRWLSNIHVPKKVRILTHYFIQQIAEEGAAKDQKIRTEYETRIKELEAAQSSFKEALDKKVLFLRKIFSQLQPQTLFPLLYSLFFFFSPNFSGTRVAQDAAAEKQAWCAPCHTGAASNCVCDTWVVCMCGQGAKFARVSDYLVIFFFCFLRLHTRFETGKRLDLMRLWRWFGVLKRRLRER